MKKNIVCFILFFTLVFIFSAEIAAVTISEAQVKCPVCGIVNTFKQLLSYGSYVYEKFPLQVVNWPFTESFPYYICKKCKYATRGGDFEDLPKNKVRPVRRALRRFRARVGFDKRLDYYEDVPVSKRLEAAETVYSVLEKDDECRSWFYLIMAYHYDKEKQDKKAAEARQKALSIATRMLETEENAGKRKWFLLTSGAMKHFLGDDNGALRDFKRALKLRARDERHDAYDTAFLMEYIKTILKSEKEQNAIKWYYELGSAYFINTFRMGPLTLLYSFPAWILFLSVPSLIGGGIRRIPGISAKQVRFEYISTFLFVVFISLGTYLFLRVFDLFHSILSAFIIGLTWLAYSLIFQRVVKRKGLDHKGLTGYLKGIVESGVWKAVRILMFVMPILMVPVLSE